MNDIDARTLRIHNDTPLETLKTWQTAIDAQYNRLNICCRALESRLADLRATRGAMKEKGYKVAVNNGLEKAVSLYMTYTTRVNATQELLDDMQSILIGLQHQQIACRDAINRYAQAERQARETVEQAERQAAQVKAEKQEQYERYRRSQALNGVDVTKWPDSIDDYEAQQAQARELRAREAQALAEARLKAAEAEEAARQERVESWLNDTLKETTNG